MKPYNMEKPVGMPNLIDRLYMSYKNAFIFIISIINNEYKLMLVRTIKDKSFGIPGGMSENAEIPIETACREFKEETGNILTKQELILHNFKKYYYKPYKSVIYYGIIPYKELNSGSIYNDEIDYIYHLDINKIFRYNNNKLEFNHNYTKISTSGNQYPLRKAMKDSISEMINDLEFKEFIIGLLSIKL
jgi:8-oxo-dGTP pyrophosphatase MutT (NUDIX family)